MEIKAKIKFEDYWRFYKRNYLFRYAPIILLFVIPLLFYAEYIFHDEYEPQDLWIYLLLFGLIIVAVLYRIYYRTKKAFTTNSRIQENHTYFFNEEGVKIQGQSFTSFFEWKSLYKITEVKEWFLIYQSASVLNLVPKKDLSSEKINNLHEIILRSGVKTKLRED